MNYIELVSGSTFNRPGMCIKKENFRTYMVDGVELYRSTFLFKNQFDRTTSYMGEYDIDYIIIDVDKSKQTDENTLLKLKALLMELDDLNIDEYSRIVYFSGTGYHILFSAKIFGFTPGHNLPETVKATLITLFPNIDTTFYNRSGIYRISHTINTKTNLYKIPLTEREVYNLSIDEIKNLALSPRKDFDYSVYEIDGNNELHDRIVNISELSIKKAFSPTRIATCIHAIANKGAEEGHRHTDIMVLTSHFKRHGIPLTFTISAIIDWIRKNGNEDLTDREIIRHVTDVYNKGYTFGCNNPLLLKHCNPYCIYYKNKNYDSGIMDFRDMHNMFKSFSEINQFPDSLKLNEIFNLSEDYISYPGEYIVLYGLTGSGKTAMAQMIINGISINGTKVISPATLYISTEMSSNLMYRRWVQQEYNIDKQRAMEISEPPPGLSHILLLDETTSIVEIERAINQYTLKLIVVDYIELIDSEIRDTTARIRDISKNLKRLAKKYNIIVLAISQISREYARRGHLDINAGFGSGGLEKDADKVIGLWGTNTTSYKKLEFFKHRDSETLASVHLKMTNSMRFIPISEEEYRDNTAVLTLNDILRR